MTAEHRLEQARENFELSKLAEVQGHYRAHHRMETIVLRKMNNDFPQCQIERQRRMTSWDSSKLKEASTKLQRRSSGKV